MWYYRNILHITYKIYSLTHVRSTKTAIQTDTIAKSKMYPREILMSFFIKAHTS